METTRTTKVRFSAKTFAKGVAKSTGAAITATLTEHTPFIASTLQDTMSTASEAATFVKENNPFRRNKRCRKFGNNFKDCKCVWYRCRYFIRRYC